MPVLRFLCETGRESCRTSACPWSVRGRALRRMSGTSGRSPAARCAVTDTTGWSATERGRPRSTWTPATVEERLRMVRKGSDGELYAACPLHDDRSPSLTVGAGKDGRVLVTCHACTPTDPEGRAEWVGRFFAALDDMTSSTTTKAKAYAAKPKRDKRRWELVRTYTYCDMNGRGLFQKVRGNLTGEDGTVEKAFIWKHNAQPDSRHPCWLVGLNGSDPGLYLPGPLAPDGVVYLTEGEGDALTVGRLGHCAVSVPHGAGVWDDRWSDLLRGRDVVVVGDRDDAGRAHVRLVVEKLNGVAASVRAVEPPEGHKDVSDMVAAGLGPDDLEDVEGPSLSPPDNTATPQQSRSGVAPPPMPTVAVAPRILDRFRKEAAGRGLVGEQRNAAIIFLSLTSRLLDQPVSVVLKGHSASGKSFVLDIVRAFFPASAYVKFTAMSSKALVYDQEEYAHRTLIFYEATGLRENDEEDSTSYLVRTLLSEGRIDYKVTVRDKAGGYTTKHYEKEGPTNLVVTTTKTHLHAENETRLLSLNTDDSRAQTARVLRSLGADESSGAADLTEWHALQDWLAEQDNRVTIPYREALAEKIPPVAVRLRRDFGAVLALIRSHALLHQASRDRDEQGRIVATLDDYAVVRDLVSDLLEEGVGATVPDTIRELVGAIETLTKEARWLGGVSLSAVAVHLKVDKSTVSRRVRRAMDGDFVVNLEDRRGLPARLVLGDPLPERSSVLPDPWDLDTGPTQRST